MENSYHDVIVVVGIFFKKELNNKIITLILAYYSFNIFFTWSINQNMITILYEIKFLLIIFIV